MNLRRLRNYLLSSCRYIQSESGTQQPSQAGLWVEWVVARSLCVFRSVDISSVSGAEQDAFLRMQVREWAPFADPECHIVAVGSRALVWAWDGDRRRNECRDNGVSPDAVIPESVLLPDWSGSADVAVQLVPCVEGFEGRGYRGSRLVVSRWWAELPELRSWNQFRMLFDMAPVEAVPEPYSMTLQDNREASMQGMVLPFLRSESTLFVLSFALCMVFAAYHGAGIAYANLALARSEAQIGELNQAVTPVLSARDEALAALDDVESMSSLHAGPLQLQYIGDLLQRLEDARQAGNDIHLMAWEYRENAVAISVASEELSAADILSLFETIPWLQGQRVGDDRVKGRMRVTADLAPGWRFPEEGSSPEAGA